MFSIEDLIQCATDLKDVQTKGLNGKQIDYIRANYNTSVRFGYGLTVEGNLLIIASRSNFQQIEYYLGMEYERDHQVIKVEMNDQFLVIYDVSESPRAERIKDILLELEDKENG